MNHARLIAILAASLMGSTAGSQEGAAPFHRSDAGTELRLAMRKLWEDHITYTRNYIISSLGDLPDADSIAERLMKNQDDIGNAVKPYYGSDAGDKLANLLRSHIKIAAEVVKAAKA